MAGEPLRVEILVNGTGPWPLPEELVNRCVGAVLDREGVEDAEISVTFVDDREIQALNEEYFGRAHPTDVIAFALHDSGDPVLGDIYVGYEQARRQASEASVPLEEELGRLAIHGVLHVLGHVHPEGPERLQSGMFILQEQILAGVLGEG